jgi:competence protein ComEC
MLAVNPLLLGFDVGFQLSFLAVMGIIYLMPSFQNWFKKVPNPNIFPVRNLLSMTISAQVFTLPILIYNFGYMSLVSPLTNILIVPLIPYLMGLGFIFSILGMLWQPLGWILSWPAWFLLTYVVKIVDWFSSFSWASLTLEISWIWLIIFYLILGLMTWRLQERQKLKFLNY